MCDPPAGSCRAVAASTREALDSNLRGELLFQQIVVVIKVADVFINSGLDYLGAKVQVRVELTVWRASQRHYNCRDGGVVFCLNDFVELAK
jgi:hypothetical protein